MAIVGFAQKLNECQSERGQLKKKSHIEAKHLQRTLPEWNSCCLTIHEKYHILIHENWV